MFADTFHETLADAVAEASRRRTDTQAAGLLTNVERSPYGGFRVRSLPADLYVDALSEMPEVARMFRRPGLAA
jgi:hypothetical protein